MRLELAPHQLDDLRRGHKASVLLLRKHGLALNGDIEHTFFTLYKLSRHTQSVFDGGGHTGRAGVVVSGHAVGYDYSHISVLTVPRNRASPD